MNTYQDVTVQLTGKDSNAYAIIGAVSRELQAAHGADVAKEWRQYAQDSSSYDELLQRAMATVNVI